MLQRGLERRFDERKFIYFFQIFSRKEVVPVLGVISFHKKFTFVQRSPWRYDCKRGILFVSFVLLAI